MDEAQTLETLASSDEEPLELSLQIFTVKSDFKHIESFTYINKLTWAHLYLFNFRK